MLKKLLILWRLLERAEIQESDRTLTFEVDGIQIQLEEGKLTLSASHLINQQAPYLFSNCSPEFIQSTLSKSEEEPPFIKPKLQPLDSQLQCLAQLD